MSAGSHGWYYTVEDVIKSFDGTPDESQANLGSHDWVPPALPPDLNDWEREIHEKYQARATKHCASCGVRDYETAANYPCGMTDFPMVKMVYEYSGDDPVRIYEYKPFDPGAPRPEESD